MKRAALVLFVAVMAALMLLLGSCALPAQATGTPAMQEASTSISLLDSRPGKDATSFLVGEFTENNGTLARFNGFGDVTIVRANGESSVGSYDMIDYGSKKAVVNIDIDGSLSSYSFLLTSGSGDFTLTDGNGNVFDFTPVVY